MNVARATSEKIREELKGFVARQALSNVSFRETTDSANNPMEGDYIVVYEAAFEPADLLHAYLKILVTDHGLIGLGFETRDRLARRLKVPLHLQKHAFAAGRELASLTVEELLDFVAIVARGQLVLQAKVGLFGLGRVRAFVTPDVGRALFACNDKSWDWISVSAKERAETFRTKVVRFEPWYR